MEKVSDSITGVSTPSSTRRGKVLDECGGAGREADGLHGVGLHYWEGFVVGVVCGLRLN